MQLHIFFGRCLQWRICSGDQNLTHFSSETIMHYSKLTFWELLLVTFKTFARGPRASFSSGISVPSRSRGPKILSGHLR